MSEQNLHPITMPKWGLSMTEGKVIDWLVEEGKQIASGDEVVDVETDKIASAVETTAAGILHRQVAKAGEIIPVSGLLGVVGDSDVPEAEIDVYVEKFLADFVPPSAEDEEEGPVYEWVQAEGIRLRYLKRGNGDQVVLLIHGFGGDLDNWMFNHEALATGGRCVYAIDLPGHGQSDKNVGAGTLAFLSQVVRSFLDAVGVDTAHLVGHSLGGAVALQFAVSFPERVRSMCLICSAGLGEEINGAYGRGFISSNTRKEIRPYLEQLFADPAVVTRQLINDILKYKRLDGVTEALSTLAATVFFGGRQQAVFRDQLEPLGKPIMVIWGSEDKIIPVSHAQSLPKSVRVEIVERKGHMVQMEACAEVNHLLEEWLPNQTL